MGKALDDSHSEAGEPARHRDWAKAMSDNVAYALLIYTGLQIFVTVDALQEGFPATMSYVALVLLVAAIIPACRWFEKRWTDLPEPAASDPAMTAAFRRDQLMLWAIAIGMPFVVTGLCKLAFSPD